MSNPGKRWKKRLVNAKLVVSVLALLFVLLIGGAVFFSYTVGVGTPRTSRSATPTVQQGTPVSSGQSITKPLFTSDFGDPDKGWAVGSASGYTRSVNNGTLTLANKNHTTLTESLPTNLTFSDFSLTITFTILHATAGDSVGLYVRGDSNLDHDYRIDFYSDKTYTISKEFLDTQNVPQETLLQPSTFVSALRPMGQSNTVTIMMRGPNMVLIVNKKVMNTVADADYSDGQIALFVHNGLVSNEVEATFSSIAIFPAPVILPGT